MGFGAATLTRAAGDTRRDARWVRKGTGNRTRGVQLLLLLLILLLVRRTKAWKMRRLLMIEILKVEFLLVRLTRMGLEFEGEVRLGSE